MKITRTPPALLLSLLTVNNAAQAAQTCNVNIPLTRPDSRYEVVASASPAGSEVRDKVTGLIWQRCMLGMGWDGSTCTGTASTTYTWQQALEAARTATASTAATGVAAAWRLPSLVELYSLAERACYIPAINITWFPATPGDSMWSSSPYADNTGYAWFVNFYAGNFVGGSKSVAYRVRLVRSGQ